MLISVSMLSSYLYCSRKLYLEQVLKLKEPPSPKAVDGTLRHQVIELVTRQEKAFVLSITKDTIENLPERLKKAYSEQLVKAIATYKDTIKELGKSLIDIYKQLWPFFEQLAHRRADQIVASSVLHNAV